ncbi:hypothetical protein, partial [Xanthomonas hortorum]
IKVLGRFAHAHLSEIIKDISGGSRSSAIRCTARLLRCVIHAHLVASHQNFLALRHFWLHRKRSGRVSFWPLAVRHILGRACQLFVYALWRLLALFMGMVLGSPQAKLKP